MQLENPTANDKFEKEIEAITQTNRTMGIEEFLLDRAKKEGVEQVKREFVVSLLTKTDFSVEQIADVVGVSTAFVKKVKKDKSA